MNAKALLAVLSLVLSFQVFSGAKGFQIKFDNYPKSSLSCWEQATEIAEKFVKETGILDAQGICTDDKKNGYDFVIEYQAEQPLKRVDSDRLLFSPLVYKSMEKCLTSKEVQEKLFAEKTGLKLFASYCSKSDYNFSSKDNFEMRLLAFGESTTLPYTASSYLFGTIYNHSAKSFVTGLQELFHKHNATATAVKITPQLGSSMLTVLYYSEKRHRILEHNSGSIPTNENCEAALADIAKDLEKQKIMPFCGRFLNHELVFMWLEAEAYSFLPSGKFFSSYDDCTAGKAANMQYFSNLVPKVKSGYCSQTKNKNEYTLTLIKVD